jgi:hypothetical protein
LFTYSADEMTAPRSESNRAGSAIVTQAMTTTSITNNAGSSRLARRSQKLPSLIRSPAHCPSSRSVIR